MDRSLALSLKATIVLLFVISIGCNPANAQAPAIQWQYCYGTSLRDYAQNIQQTSDSGYILSGVADSSDGQVTYNHGKGDIWLAKLSKDGAIQWQRSYGGSKNENGMAIQTHDGGYFIGGNTNSDDGDITALYGYSDAWVAKLNDTGAILWQRSFGGDSVSSISAFQQTNDGGYILAGGIIGVNGDTTLTHGNYDYWVVRLNDTGGLMWQKMLGGTGDDFAQTIKQTIDGGYIVGGFASSDDGQVSGNHGSYDHWLVKLNDTGGITWQRTYGGTNDELLVSLQQTKDTGYILCGYTNSSDGDITANYGSYDVWLVKVNRTGAITWTKNYGGSHGDFARSIQQTTDGGYIIGGSSSSDDGDVTGLHSSTADDIWVIKTDDTGYIQWQGAYGGGGDDADPFIIQTWGSSFVFAGTTQSDDGDVTGYHGGYGDLWVVKLNNPAIAGAPPVLFTDKILVYPTVTNGLVQVSMPPSYKNASFRLINILGQTIDITSDGNATGRLLHIANAANGLYILQVINDRQVHSFRLIFQN